MSWVWPLRAQTQLIFYDLLTTKQNNFLRLSQPCISLTSNLGLQGDPLCRQHGDLLYVMLG